jgi:hypothetical protein
MTLQEWGAVGDLIGGVAIIVSLIYVAFQIRQHTHQVWLHTNQAVDTSNNAAFDPVYIPENYDVWCRGHADYDSLTKSEVQLFEMLMMRVMGSFMTTSFHYDQGAYKSDNYHGLLIFYSGLMASPGGTKVYQKHLDLFPESVRRKIDETNLTRDKGTPTQPPPQYNKKGAGYV